MIRPPSPTSIDWLLILLLSVLWGGSFFFMKVALQDFGPLTIVWTRLTIAAIVLISAVYLTGNKLPRSIAVWRQIGVMGLINNAIPFSLIVWGETQIDSSLASILNATTPIFTVILAHFFTQDERLTVGRSIGVGLGILGVIVLMGLHNLQHFDWHQLGQLAALGAAFSYGCAGNYGRRFKPFSPLVMAAGMVTTAAIVLFPLALGLEKPWTVQPALSTLGSLLALGLFCTATAYVLYFMILGRVGATYVALVTFLVPISALMLGVFILGERLSWNAIGGMVLIFAGLGAIDRFKR